MCVHVCVHPCACTCVCALIGTHVYVAVHGSHRTTYTISLTRKTGSLTGLQLYKIRLAGQGVLTCLPPWHWDYKHISTPRLFTWVLDIKLRSSKKSLLIKPSLQPL